MPATEHLSQLFSNTPARSQLNGVEAANKAVAGCAPDISMIFLTRSEYGDLLIRSRLPELKSYKKKTIFIVSDEVENP